MAKTQNQNRHGPLLYNLKSTIDKEIIKGHHSLLLIKYFRLLSAGNPMCPVATFEMYKRLLDKNIKALWQNPKPVKPQLWWQPWYV